MTKRRRVLGRMLGGFRALRGAAEPHESFDEALLFGFQERATRATEQSISTCQTAGATVHAIGDAVVPRRVGPAISEGHALASKLARARAGAELGATA